MTGVQTCALPISLSVLKVTGRMLTMNGHTVATATNGSIGLKMMKAAYVTQEYDLVLTDIQMPVMDGIEATRRYREFEEGEIDIENNNRIVREKSDSSVDSNSRIDDLFSYYNVANYTNNTNKIDQNRLIIIGMSANSDSLTEQEALDCGMDYFLSKPFAYKQLLPIFEHLHRND